MTSDIPDGLGIVKVKVKL